MIHWQTYYQQNKHLPLNTIMEGYKKLTLEFAERMVLITQQSQNVGSGYYSSSTPAGPSGIQRAIFGYGINFGAQNVSITNLVSNTGIIAADTTGVGTARQGLAAAGYGTDKAIFGFGETSGVVAMTNLVSNTGVVANDTAAVSLVPRKYISAAEYGTDKAIFAGGSVSGETSSTQYTNLVSNTGVIASDVYSNMGERMRAAGVGYGGDKAIFGYGANYSNPVLNSTYLVSNTGTFSSGQSTIGTARYGLAAASYGTDKAIFGFGSSASTELAITNLVSNTGVVAGDQTIANNPRYWLAAAGYGGDKAIFSFGVNIGSTNLVSNTGVISSLITQVGTGRYKLAAAGYSLS